MIYIHKHRAQHFLVWNNAFPRIRKPPHNGWLSSIYHTWVLENSNMFRHWCTNVRVLQIQRTISTNTVLCYQSWCGSLLYSFVTHWGWHLDAETRRSFLWLMYEVYLIVCILWWILKLRKKLVKCYIWSIALYGAETWTLRAVDQKQLESSEMWCWRRMEKISWNDH